MFSTAIYMAVQRKPTEKWPFKHWSWMHGECVLILADVQIQYQQIHWTTSSSKAWWEKPQVTSLWCRQRRSSVHSSVPRGKELYKTFHLASTWPLQSYSKLILPHHWFCKNFKDLRKISIAKKYIINAYFYFINKGSKHSLATIILVLSYVIQWKKKSEWDH